MKFSAIFVLGGWIFLWANFSFAQVPQKADSTIKSSQLLSAVETTRTNLAAKTQIDRPQISLSKPSPFLHFVRTKWKDILLTISILANLVMAFLAYWRYLRRRRLAREKAREETHGRHEGQKEIEEERRDHALAEYKDCLKRELGELKILGSPDIKSIPVELMDTFVSLEMELGTDNIHVDGNGRGTSEVDAGRQEIGQRMSLEPDDALKFAFARKRFLVIKGLPGSGKTSLLQYFVIQCLENDGYKRFGFANPVIPLYLELRNFDHQKNLAANLYRWARNHELAYDIKVTDFNTWLKHHDTLILLDGLDEKVDYNERKTICRKIETYFRRYDRSRFIMTTRPYGLEGESEEKNYEKIQLSIDHMEAEILDFSDDKKKQFLHKWYRAVFKQDHYPENAKISREQWQKHLEARADEKAKTIIEFLEDKKNRSLRQMAGNPLILQIMALIWYDRHYLPDSLGALYDAAINHLLGYRDRDIGIEPPLMPDESRGILEPVALYMQCTLKKEEISFAELEKQINEAQKKYSEPLDFRNYVDYLIRRAGILTRYGQQHLVFRHKSIREFLAGARLASIYSRENWIGFLVNHFGVKSWVETLLFFMAKTDEDGFDAFMQRFFESDKSRSLDAKGKEYLFRLILATPSKNRSIEALKRHLLNEKTTQEQKELILDCLRQIGSQEAKSVVEEFLQKKATGRAEQKAQEILQTQFADTLTKTKLVGQLQSLSLQLKKSPLPTSFPNPVEFNAEYILIPGGEYLYQKGKKWEKRVSVPDMYFAKYPVTNRLYRRFIAYLEMDDEVNELLAVLPFGEFADCAKKASRRDELKYMHKYLKKDENEWAAQLRSALDDDRRFNQDDQPVVGVTWYAARLYCFWLSLLEWRAGGQQEPDMDVLLRRMYRLPRDTEWEWAASGGKRIYPWGDEDPDDTRANFGRNVGKTTPVGAYPDGATPEGLMDMAGNVWEWQENWYDDDKDTRSLRGGSWDNDPGGLQCTGRGNANPVNRLSNVGFRVVRPSL